MSKTGKELAIVNGEFSVDLTLEDIKEKYAKNATDQELALFVDQCKANKLDPRKREAYFVKYGKDKYGKDNPGQTVTGYQVYIKRAEETGQLNGWEISLSEDGKVATIKIYRKDWDHPFVWPVYREEHDTGYALWKDKPKFMLRKVAIGQGFRLAFSEALGNLPYLSEELGQLTGSRSIDTDAPPMIDITDKVEVEKPAPKKKAVKKEKKVEKQAEEPTKVEETSTVVEEKVEKTTVAGKLSGDMVQKITDAFKNDHGVTVDEINKMLGIPSVDHWNELHRQWLLDIHKKLSKNELAVEAVRDGSLSFLS